MPQSVKIGMTLPDHVSGSAPYTVSITITNLGSTDIVGAEAHPGLWPGRLLMTQADVKDVEETELEARRRSIIKEMEGQVAWAHENQSVKNLSALKTLAYFFVSIVETYINAFSRRIASKVLPEWTDQALRIHDWEDVESLERDIISAEEDGSRIKKAFFLDKEKLRRCIELLAQRSAQPKEFGAGVSLAKGSSVTFPFTGTAPHLLRRRSFDVQFKITYREHGSDKLTSESIAQRVVFAPSAFAVPTGGMIGAACGYAIRRSLDGGNTALTIESGWQMFGSILLGLVVSLLVSRKPETYKAITAEDFLGGFLIGALSGLFSEALFEKLRLLVQTHPKS